ncbi:MAG TPA: copper-containing nitrite reductase [Terriglobales bacterium]|jgi:nitrite reductase (NO-forming)|nr:copper-containing nitrite reductase [Terriglobales bacterium]
MKTRSHSEFLYVQVLFLIFLGVIAESKITFAQTTSHSAHQGTVAKPADIVRDPTDIPPPITYRTPTLVRVTLTAKEVLGNLDPSAGTTYRYWTFNGKVPGPMIRVRQGDTVEVTLQNDASSHMAHSVDFHAALGPGGGAALSQTTPGQSKTFTFKATTPGLFVYHCGTPMIAEHMANGMYGLILVEPEAGLSHVDHEYYVMQGEIYTAEPKGKEGQQQFSAVKLMAEKPEYFVFNGAVDALTTEHPMPAKVGETVRVLFGNAGPNETSSSHVVGEIFTKVYQDGSLTSPPLTDVQTAGVPSGAAAVFEFAARKPGKFALMDHAISRMAKGNMAVFDISGTDDVALMHPGPAAQDGSQSTTASVRGITPADDASNAAGDAANSPETSGANLENPASGSDMSGMMGMHMQNQAANLPKNARKAPVIPNTTATTSTRNASTTSSLNGCLTIAPDGKAILNVLQSSKVYRLEAQPFLFSQNANRLVHVGGYFGSVLTVEDPRLPSFVVSTVDAVAPNCNVKISTAQIQKVLMKNTAATKGIVGMSEMGFLPQTLVVNAGEKVVWKNTSDVTHNVVADAAKALYRVDVKLPSGAKPFGSDYLQPGQSFSRVFEVPGIYHYVCTLHEGSGMKGVIIVKGRDVLTASK